MATTDRYRIEIDAKQATAAIGGLKTAVKGFIGVLAAREVVDFGKAIVNATKEFQQYQNQLRLITKDSADLQRVTSLLQQTAVKNRTAFGDTVDLFTKLRVSTEALGISEERVVDVTSKLSQALQVAGADAGTASGVIRQFGQAMASGTVRGDEFNSLVEGLGPALAIMARESGINVGELRRMSQAGELTAETLFKMLENSKSLTAAFNSMAPTIGQLETALGDAFDRALVKLGELTGATSAYEGLIQSLTRRLDQFAGTAGAIGNLTGEELFAGVENGSISAQVALDELETRLDEITQKYAGGTNYLFPNLSIFTDKAQEEIRSVEELRDKMATLAEQEQRNAAAAKKAQEEIKARTAALKEILQPFDAAIKKGKEFQELDFRTPLEKARDNLDAARKTLNELNKAQEILNKNSELNKDGLMDLSAEVRAAEAAVAGYQGEIDKLTKTTGFEDFYATIVEGAQRTVSELDFAKQAIQRLGEQLAAGTISVDVYNTAMESLKKTLGDVKDYSKEIAEAVDNTLKSAQERAQTAYDDISLAGLDGLERKLREIELQELRIMRQAQERIKAQFSDADPAKVKRALDDIERNTRAVIANRQEAARAVDGIARQTERSQRSFAYGWEKAFKEYRDNATNAAKTAERVFNKATSGMEDMIVNFAKTGKFEWKSFVSSMLEELLRSQIQVIFANLMGSMQDTFGGGGSSGGGLLDTIGNLFGFGGGSSAGRGSSANNPLYVTDVGGGMGGGSIFGGAGGGASPTGGIWDTVKSTGTKIWEGVKSVGSGIGSALSNVVGGITSGIGSLVSGAGNVISSVVGGIGSTIGNVVGGISDFFGGFFANGGTLGAGKWGIAGENGPELISGPAQVTPMMGTNVTYNINAVDALSFKQLLAQDPSFLYGLTMQGAKGIPVRR